MSFNRRTFSNSNREILDKQVEEFLEKNKQWKLGEAKASTYNGGPKRKLVIIYSQTVERKR